MPTVNPERYRAPALWLVTGAIIAVTWVGLAGEARLAAVLLAVTLVCAGVSRLALRGRRPEGIAVRTTWVDVAVLTALATGIGVLASTPGV